MISEKAKERMGLMIWNEYDKGASTWAEMKELVDNIIIMLDIVEKEEKEAQPNDRLTP